MSANKDSFFYFSHFDPMNDELPDYLRLKGNLTLYNARKILNNRTNEEIYSAAEIISWLTSNEELINITLEDIQKKLLEDEYFDEEEIPYTCAYSEDLLTSMKLFDISDYDDFKNATWPEFFAVLALGMIADAFENYESHKQHTNELTREMYSYEAFGDAIIDATECICIAKHIISQDELTKELKENASIELKKKQSLQGKKASIIRHSKVNNLKRECYEYFHAQSESGISKRQAAHDFYESLPSERQRLLAPTNAVRTLAEGITHFENCT